MRFAHKKFLIFFLVLTFLDCMHDQGDRSDKLVVTATGTGGLAELQEQLDPDKASYAYARVTYSNDKESQREKFILITWIGSGCKIMRKAKVRLFRISCIAICICEAYPWTMTFFDVLCLL